MPHISSDSRHTKVLSQRYASEDNSSLKQFHQYLLSIATKIKPIFWDVSNIKNLSVYALLERLIILYAFRLPQIPNLPRPYNGNS